MTRGWRLWLTALLVVAISSTVIVVVNKREAADRTLAGGDVASDTAPTLTPDEQELAAVQWLIDQGIYVLPEGQSVDPALRVTRAEFVGFLYRFDGKTDGGPCADGSAPYADVQATSEDCRAITWARDLGIVLPSLPDTFSPDLAPTRDFAVFAFYHYDHPGVDVGPCQGEKPYPDVDPTSLACEPIRWASVTPPAPIFGADAQGDFHERSDLLLGGAAVAFYNYKQYAPDEANVFEYTLMDGVVEIPVANVKSMSTVVLQPAVYNANGAQTRSEVAEWVLVLDAGAPALRNGQGVFVHPGSAPVPKGLGGTVTAIQETADGRRVTLESATIEQTFSDLHVHIVQYVDLDSGSYGDASSGNATLASFPSPVGGAGLGLGTMRGVQDIGAVQDAGGVPDISGVPIECENTGGKNAEKRTIMPAITDGLSLTFENSRNVFNIDWHWFEFKFPTVYDAYTYTEPVLKSKLGAGASGKCTLTLPLAPTPIGPSGVVFQLKPKLSIGVTGTISAGGLIEARGYMQIGVKTDDNGDLVSANDFAAGLENSNFAAEVSYWAKAALGMELSFITFIGFSGEVGLKAELGVGYKNTYYGLSSELCLSSGVYVYGEVGWFVDAKFKRWDGTFASFEREIWKGPGHCWFKDPDPPRLITVGDPDSVYDEPHPINDSGPGPGSATGGTGFGGDTGDTGSTGDDSSTASDETLATVIASANAAVAAANRAALEAADAQDAAAAAVHAASDDFESLAQAQAAADMADVAAAEAADAQTAALAALTAAEAASTVGEANAAQALVGVADGLAASALVDARDAASESYAVLDYVLPSGPLDTTFTPVTISAGDLWSLGPGDIHVWGDPSRTPYLLPVTMPFVPAVKSVSAGNGGTVMVGTDGTVWAWNIAGTPQQVTGLPDVDSVYQCNDMEYAVGTAGGLYQWDTYAGGPAALVSGPSDAVQLECVSGATIVRTSTGQVWYWGTNGVALTGVAGTSVDFPLRVPGVSDAVDVAVSYNDACYVRATGTVWCWGRTMATIDTDPYDPDWSLGLWPDVTTPTQIVRVTDAVDLTIGMNDWFVRTADGHMWVWGLNDVYSLGDGTNEWRPIPILLASMDDVASIERELDTHGWSTYVLKNDGTVWDWGVNFHGDLGDGTEIVRREPMQVPRISGIVKLMPVNGCVYALDSSGTLWFWDGRGGLNYIGYDYPYDLLLRPVPITHLNGISDFAAGTQRLFVWTN